MATEAELIEGIRRAGRANDAEAVRVLGKQLERVRAQSASKPGNAAQNAPRKEKPTSFWQGVGEEVWKARNNVADFANTINPVGALIDAGSRALGYDPAKTEAGMRGKVQAKFDNSGYRGSTAGKVVGGVIATLPTLAAPGGVIAQGALGGAMLTDKRGLGVLGDMATGALAGKAGDLAGRYVVAPVARQAAKLIPQSVKNAAGNLGSTLLSSAPRLTKGEQTILKNAAPQTMKETILRRPSAAEAQVRQNLQDAARNNLPYALADASPQLRTISGSVARKSIDARDIAENAFGPRAEAQASRAIQAINRNLTPAIDPVAVKQGIVTAGQAKAAPLYDAAYAATQSGGSTWSPRIQQFLDDPITAPALKRGMELQRIDTLAAGKPFDPTRLSVTDFDAAGNPILSKTPNMQTLDTIKRGFDDIVSQETDAVTGKLTGQGRAVDGLRRAFVKELDTINPVYGDARKAAQQYIRTGNAIGEGMKATAPAVAPRDLVRAVGNMSPKELAQFRSGYATSLRDMAGKASDSANPYKQIYGGLDRREKMGLLFPEGAPKIDRVYNLEKDMAKTAYETIGGSPTQSRNMADQQFDSALVPVLDMASGTGGALSLLRSGARAVGDAYKVGAGKARADQMAPLLFDTNPANALNILDELFRKRAEQEAQRRAWGSLLGGVSAPVAVGVSGTP
jgi:hypothetical protein